MIPPATVSSKSIVASSYRDSFKSVTRPANWWRPVILTNRVSSDPILQYLFFVYLKMTVCVIIFVVFVIKVSL